MQIKTTDDDRQPNVFFAQFIKGGFPMMQSPGHLNAKNKEAALTAIRTGEAVSQKLQEINQQMIAAFYDSIELNTATMKALLNVKTGEDFFALQSKWLSHSVKEAFANAVKFSSWSFKVAGEIAEPMRDHYKAAISDFNKAA